MVTARYLMVTSGYYTLPLIPTFSMNEEGVKLIPSLFRVKTKINKTELNLINLDGTGVLKRQIPVPEQLFNCF